MMSRLKKYRLREEELYYLQAHLRSYVQGLFGPLSIAALITWGPINEKRLKKKGARNDYDYHCMTISLTKLYQRHNPSRAVSKYFRVGKDGRNAFHISYMQYGHPKSSNSCIKALRLKLLAAGLLSYEQKLQAGLRINVVSTFRLFQLSPLMKYTDFQKTCAFISEKLSANFAHDLIKCISRVRAKWFLFDAIQLKTKAKNNSQYFRFSSAKSQVGAANRSALKSFQF